MIKRTFDILLSLAGIALLSPLFLAIALAIKFESRGPVFFLQKRIGRNFKTFKLYKFRSMVQDAPQKGLSITVGGDPRVTGVGRFIRKFKLDELPQLINVLKGDMSLVGPRPEVRRYVRKFRSDYRKILSVRPGITDISSITFRDEESVLRGKENPEDFYVNYLLPEKIKLAKEYVGNMSLRQDLLLICLTIFKIAYPGAAIDRAIESMAVFRRSTVILLELVIFALSNYLAFLIRFDGAVPASEVSRFFAFLPVYLVIRLVFLFVFSIDRGVWRYVSVKDLFNLGAALLTGTVFFYGAVHIFFGETSYPQSVFVIDWFLNMSFLTWLRFMKKIHDRLVAPAEPYKKRAIIIGAGDGAELLIRNIMNSGHSQYKLIGMVDDNPAKKGLSIRGFKVLGTRADLPELLTTKEPDELIIAIPSLSDGQMAAMVEALRACGLPIKVMPGMHDMLAGKAAGELKPINTEDVLFRQPVTKEDGVAVGAFLKGKTVMVTGAGGSIGSELSKQIASFRPDRLILFEQHEESLYKIDMHLKGAGFGDIIVPVIGDVADSTRVAEVFDKYKPQVIYHAAAYKHVPLMENNLYEAFKTNVMGTKIVARAAGRNGAGKFMLISTDKAVNPVNVMGKTKRLAEKIVMGLASSGEYFTSYNVVRFGNVLGSSGSVVPLFTEQIKKGGPVTVTHPDIIRYFMTIPEAVRLVLHASEMGSGGDVFVLDMGEPVKILDLAKRMISLHGFKPGIDIQINFSGLRPGEKLYEDLFNQGERVLKTAHPKIRKAISAYGQSEELLDLLHKANANVFPKDKLSRLLDCEAV